MPDVPGPLDARELRIPEEALWDLVDKWREEAAQRAGGDIEMPYLSPMPRTAHAQGLNSAAEDLADLILALDDAAVAAAVSGANKTPKETAHE